MNISQNLSDANLHFALDLLNYASQNKEKENFICSPFSIFGALNVLVAGGKGQTVSEIQKALHLEKVDISTKSYHEAVAKFMEIGELSEETFLANANRLYLQKDLQPDSKFAEIVKNVYKQDVEKIDFGDGIGCCGLINRWIYENTNSSIKMMTAPESFQAGFKLALMNAIHLRSSWFHRFDTEKTESKPFYLSKTETIYVPTMDNLCDLNVGLFPDDKLKVLSLKLDNGENFSLIIILPDHYYALKEVISSLTPDKIKKYISKLKTEIVSVQIPTFNVYSSLHLDNVLKSLGVKSIFEETSAELKDITGQEKVPLSLPLHKTQLNIDEEGVETLVPTGLFSELACCIPEPVQFYIDHPFAIAVYDKKKKTIIFIGQIVNPSV